LGAPKTLALWTAGAGLLALGVGAVYAIHAKSLDEESRADDHCDDATGCDAVGRTLNRQALNAGRLATGLFVAGGVLVVGGATIYLLGGRSTGRERSTSLGLSPAAAPGAVGVAARGWF
jgi:hypothetical protein